jgi:cytochrome c oxidase subunit 3
MEIPYSVEPRPDTGLTNGKIGIGLFLASEVMLFGALFAAYVMLRVGAVSWPRGSEVLDVSRGVVATLLLVVSVVTMLLASRAAGQGSPARSRGLMGLTVVLGVAFVALALHTVSALTGAGLYPRTSTFLAIFFALTGLHVVHAIAGVAVNAYLLGAGTADPRRSANRVECAGYYWCFVAIVGAILFVVFHLL